MIATRVSVKHHFECRPKLARSGRHTFYRLLNLARSTGKHMRHLFPDDAACSGHGRRCQLGVFDLVNEQTLRGGGESHAGNGREDRRNETEKKVLFALNEDWLAKRREEPIDPAMPIIDPHHHLWDRGSRYLLDDLKHDII